MNALGIVGELRLKYRALLEELPPAELVVPSDVARRKSELWYLELPEHLPREVAFQLIRESIDEAYNAGIDSVRPAMRAMPSARRKAPRAKAVSGGS